MTTLPQIKFSGLPRRVSLPRSCFFLMLAFNAGCSHTPDDDLKRVFTENKTRFEKLVTMKQQDPSILSISMDTIYSPNFTKLSAVKWDQYRDLMRRLKVSRIDAGDESQVRFRVNGPSLLNGAREKGYLYSRTAISSNLESNLDGFRPAPANAYPGYEVYKHLEGSWYLYMTLE